MSLYILAGEVWERRLLVWGAFKEHPGSFCVNFGFWGVGTRVDPCFDAIEVGKSTWFCGPHFRMKFSSKEQLQCLVEDGLERSDQANVFSHLLASAFLAFSLYNPDLLSCCHGSDNERSWGKGNVFPCSGIWSHHVQYSLTSKSFHVRFFHKEPYLCTCYQSWGAFLCPSWGSLGCNWPSCVFRLVVERGS